MASSHRSHSISARLVSIGLVACVSLGACAGLRPGSADDQSMTAMATALADTSASRRVYLPDEVERPATVIEEGDKRAVALRTIAEPSELRAGIRGVIDARGVVERGTLLDVPCVSSSSGACAVRVAAAVRTT